MSHCGGEGLEADFCWYCHDVFIVNQRGACRCRLATLPGSNQPTGLRGRVKDRNSGAQGLRGTGAWRRRMPSKWELKGVADFAVLAQQSTCYTLSAFRTPTSRKESSVQPRIVGIIGTARTVLQVDSLQCRYTSQLSWYLFPLIAYLQLQRRQRHGNVMDRVVH